MAVDVYSNNTTSPRISFSHDLEDTETIPIETNRLDPCLLDPSAIGTATSSIHEFAFSIDDRIRPDEFSSTADELFSDGKILPVDIKRDRADDIDHHETTTTATGPHSNNAEAVIQNVAVVTEDVVNPNGNKKNLKSLREFLADSTDEDDENEEENPSGGSHKSFWKFRRSSSLNNCRDEHAGNRRLIKPLKLLSRSKSAGEYISKQMSIIQEEGESEPKSFWKFNRSNTSSINISSNNNGNKGLIGSIKVLLRSESSSGSTCLDNEKSSMPKSEARFMRRSSSLNSDKYHVQVSIGSMTFLSRSNSTGTAPPKQYYLKQHSIRRQKSIRRNASGKSYISRLSNSSTNADAKGTQVQKNCKTTSPSGSSVKVINSQIPSPYISRATVGLSGFSSLFCNKDKKKKR